MDSVVLTAHWVVFVQALKFIEPQFPNLSSQYQQGLWFRLLRDEMKQCLENNWHEAWGPASTLHCHPDLLCGSWQGCASFPPVGMEVEYGCSLRSQFHVTSWYDQRVVFCTLHCIRRWRLGCSSGCSPSEGNVTVLGPGFGTYVGPSLALPAKREDSCVEETKACLGHQCQERGYYLWAQPLWPGSLGWHHMVPPSVPKPSERNRPWAEVAAIQVVLAL